MSKDYFCSVLIEYLSESDTGLVFKGGTCLSRVYADFCRLSEDLDYVIPTPFQSKRPERSRRASGVNDNLDRPNQGCSLTETANLDEEKS